MPVFNSEEELKAYVLKASRKAIAATEAKIYAVIRSNLEKFYSEYKPEEYITTASLLNSLVKTAVIPVGDGYTAEVYFDVGSLGYRKGQVNLQSTPKTGRMGYAKWADGKILSSAMEGSHGGYTSGTAIWPESMAELGDIVQLIVSELRAAGIPVV